MDGTGLCNSCTIKELHTVCTGATIPCGLHEDAVECKAAIDGAGPSTRDQCGTYICPINAAFALNGVLIIKELTITDPYMIRNKITGCDINFAAVKNDLVSCKAQIHSAVDHEALPGFQNQVALQHISIGAVGSIRRTVNLCVTNR